MTQPRDPTNDFVEFVQVWRDGAVCDYLEGVVMYDSRNGRFTVQVGHMIWEGKLINGKQAFEMISTKGEIKMIQRQKGKHEGKYTIVAGGGKITTSRTYLPAS